MVDESCTFWRCGRLALYTCGGCREEPYCGWRCHRDDWQNHRWECAGTIVSPGDGPGFTGPRLVPTLFELRNAKLVVIKLLKAAACRTHLARTGISATPDHAYVHPFAYHWVGAPVAVEVELTTPDNHEIITMTVHRHKIAPRAAADVNGKPIAPYRVSATRFRGFVLFSEERMSRIDRVYDQKDTLALCLEAYHNHRMNPWYCSEFQRSTYEFFKECVRDYMVATTINIHDAYGWAGTQPQLSMPTPPVSQHGGLHPTELYEKGVEIYENPSNADAEQACKEVAVMAYRAMYNVSDDIEIVTFIPDFPYPFPTEEPFCVQVDIKSEVINVIITVKMNGRIVTTLQTDSVVPTYSRLTSLIPLPCAEEPILEFLHNSKGYFGLLDGPPDEDDEEFDTSATVTRRPQFDWSEQHPSQFEQYVDPAGDFADSMPRKTTRKAERRRSARIAKRARK